MPLPQKLVSRLKRWYHSRNSALSSPTFPWPEGKRAALSLSFDDARLSQVKVGLPLLDRYNIKATFFVLPDPVEQQQQDWQRVLASGHEIGNHSLHHPCSGNFAWARTQALEDYSLSGMAEELRAANQRIAALLGTTPITFAYPCGQTFVGRGAATQSYVPLVAELFLAGRGFFAGGINDPGFADLAQIVASPMDNQRFSQILPLVQAAQATGGWLVLAGHEVGSRGFQTTFSSMLDKLLRYGVDRRNGLWLAPVGTVAHYIHEQRQS